MSHANGLSYQERVRLDEEKKRVKQLIKPAIKALVWEKTSGRCWYCGVQTVPWRNFHVDHFTPVTSGGKTEIANLVPACSSCNVTKGWRPLEFLRDRLAHRSANAERFSKDQLDYLKRNNIQIPEVEQFTFFFEKEGL